MLGPNTLSNSPVFFVKLSLILYAYQLIQVLYGEKIKHIVLTTISSNTLLNFNKVKLEISQVVKIVKNRILEKC